MIKTIQLLKESFITYKSNFKNIFNMAWPIVLLTIVAQYYLVGINQRMEAGQFDIPYLIVATLIYFVCALVVGLFLTPALSRSIQKNEDNGVFSVKEGYDFQKKNIWKFIMVNIWGFLYILKRLWSYIAASFALGVIAFMFNDSDIVALTAASLMVLIILVGFILNITRFVLYKNIFFSKDTISPRDAVKESMSLGVNKMSNIWKIILAMIILAIGIELVIVLFEMLSVADIYGLIIGSIVMVMFSLPYMLIIASKGYVRVRGGDVALPMEEVVEVV
jgi:hypothetical protein